MYLSWKSSGVTESSTPVVKKHKLTPTDRKSMALSALAGGNVTQIASDHGVSRKCVYQQKKTAMEAIDQAFPESSKTPSQEKVLFEIKMTKPQLEQLILAMVLCGRSSYRTIQRIILDVFDYTVSLGKISQIVHRAATKATQINSDRDLSDINIACHDELFCRGYPCFVAVEPLSRYCFLLSDGNACNELEWTQALQAAAAQGYDPAYMVADGGTPLRSGIHQVFPETPCYYDLFHLSREFGRVILAIRQEKLTCQSDVQELQERIQRYQITRKTPRDDSFDILDQRTKKIEFLDQALVTVKEGLGRLLNKAFSLSANYSFAEREAFFDKTLDSLCDTLRNRRNTKYHADRLCPLLYKQKDNLLGLFKRNDCLAQIRASSMVENFNFSLRQQFQHQNLLDKKHQNLQRFYLNHRRFLAAHSTKRQNRSPAELLDKKILPHWLEMLGYQRVRQSVT